MTSSADVNTSDPVPAVSEAAATVPAQFPRTDVVRDHQSRHCGSPVPKHNICYSPPANDAIPLASQHQLRWV
jgi:hypothetical protein